MGLMRRERRTSGGCPPDVAVGPELRTRASGGSPCIKLTLCFEEQCVAGYQVYTRANEHGVVVVAVIRSRTTSTAVSRSRSGSRPRRTHACQVTAWHQSTASQSTTSPSGPFTVVVPNSPIGSGISDHPIATGSTDPRQLPFGPGTAPVSGQLSRKPLTEVPTRGPGFPPPFRPPAFASWVILRSLGSVGRIRLGCVAGDCGAGSTIDLATHQRRTPYAKLAIDDLKDTAECITALGQAFQLLPRLNPTAPSCCQGCRRRLYLWSGAA